MKPYRTMKNFIFLAFWIILASPLFSQDLQTGLVASYPFCGDLTDHSGNGNHGEFKGTGNPVFTTDRFGEENRAMYFDGTYDYIRVPASETINSPLNEVTVAAWVNYESLWNDQTAPILTKTIDEIALSRQYSLGFIKEGYFYYNTTAIGQWDIVPGYWFHIAMTYSPDTISLYVNGTLIGEREPYHVSYANELPLEIGRDLPDAIDFFHGSMDDVYIYNRILDSDEIMALMDYDACGPASIEESDIGSLADIYPNPVTDRLNIEFHQEGAYLIKLIDARGKTCFSGHANGIRNIIYTGRLAEGIYLLQVSDGHMSGSRKILKY